MPPEEGSLPENRTSTGGGRAKIERSRYITTSFEFLDAAMPEGVMFLDFLLSEKIIFFLSHSGLGFCCLYS